MANYTTNAQIHASLANAVYKSIHTGKEVDEGISSALGIRDYIETYIHVPVRAFNGDFLRVTINKFRKNVWLHSIVLRCVIPFSKSVGKYHYWIEMVDGTHDDMVTRLIEVPTAVMTRENGSVEYIIDRGLPEICEIAMCGDSINAFGRIDIKLLLG